MKKIKPFLLYSLIGITLLNSCSVEKRVHLSGYHINWKSAKKNIDTQEIADNYDSNIQIEKQSNPILKSTSDDLTIYETVENENIVQSSNNNNEVITNKQISKEVKKDLKIKNKSDDCGDIIILKNGQEIKSKVYEVTNEEIKYKECNNLNGPTFNIKKSEVFMIKYPNGTNTLISSIETKNNNTQNTAESTSNKSQTIAFILCFLLGILGIHRFYLGHIGIGVLYLLTFGLCGIGALVDLILILTGGLKPKNGEYKDKL
jgi:TM2 domain-containing membrane protein YozV